MRAEQDFSLSLSELKLGEIYFDQDDSEVLLVVKEAEPPGSGCVFLVLRSGAVGEFQIPRRMGDLVRYISLRSVKKIG